MAFGPWHSIFWDAAPFGSSVVPIVKPKKTVPRATPEAGPQMDHIHKRVFGDGTQEDIHKSYDFTAGRHA